MHANVLALLLLAAALPARAEPLALPGPCVKPAPPAYEGAAVTPKPADPIDLDGDGKPDVIIGNHESCDGRMNCNYSVYVMRGACGHQVGFGPDAAFDGTFRLKPTVHHGLHDLEASFLGIGEFNTIGLTFDGERYVATVEDSAKRGGLDDQGRDDAAASKASAEAAYKAAMRKARKLDGAGDHAGAVAAFREAVTAATNEGGPSLSNDQSGEAELELGAAALAAGTLDVAEEATRQGLYELHASGDAPRAKIVAIGWYNLGMIALARGDLTTALDAQQQSARFNPTAAAKQRVAALEAKVLKTTVDGKGLPALAADGATMALRLGGKVAFVPAGAGFDPAGAVALSPATIDDVNRRLADGGFRTIAARRVEDRDPSPSLASRGLEVRFSAAKSARRSVSVSVDMLELEVPDGTSHQVAIVPDVTALTGVALVRTAKAGFLYLELGGRTLQVVPLKLPATK